MCAYQRVKAVWVIWLGLAGKYERTNVWLCVKDKIIKKWQTGDFLKADLMINPNMHNIDRKLDFKLKQL